MANRALALKQALYSIIAILATASCAPVSGPNADAQNIARIERGLIPLNVIAGHPLPQMNLQSRMRYYHIPAVSIAFFDSSGIRWERAYGASTNTLFQAGSISKPVSAVGMLRLVEAGRLKLNENVNDTLRSWKVPDNAFTAKQPVTLRELLSHTAGTTAHGFGGYERGKPLPTLIQVLDGAGPANSKPIRVQAQPGTRFQYSGGGYVVAEQLVVDREREPFATYMRDNVLAPLGMADSTFEQPLPKRLWNRAAAATDEAGTPYPGAWHVYPEQSAAGLWTTPSDLAKFAMGVERALDGEPNAILSQNMAREMLTPVKPGYGLGFIVDGSGPAASFSHDGVNAGFQAFFVMHRGGDGVAIMTDSDNGNPFINELLNGIAETYGWKDHGPTVKTLFPVKPNEYGRFVGTYDLGGGATVRVLLRSGALYAIGNHGHLHRLYPESSTKFFSLEEDLDLAFTTNAAGAIDGVMILGQKAKKQRPQPGSGS